MKHVFLMMTILTLSVTSYAVDTAPAIAHENLTLKEWSKMSPKDYTQATGVKLNFKDRLAHRYLTMKSRKAIKNGELTGSEMAPAATQTGWGLGFVLGLLFGLIGVLIALVIQLTDKSGTKSKTLEGSLWGVLAVLVLVIIIVVAAGSSV